MSSQIVPSQTLPSETEARSNRSDEALALEEDARLRTDIRLLGRILGANAIGAALPIFGHSVWLLAISALVFGVAFFAVVGSTTAFVRFNYPPQAWPTAIAAMTISFGIGQTLGPIVVGAITDAMGSLSFALNVSAAMLALGAVLSAFQRKVERKSANSE